METNPVYYIAALIGVIVHYAKYLYDTQSQNGVLQWKAQLFKSAMTAVMAMALVAFRLEVVDMLVKMGIDIRMLADSKIMWFLMGFFADAIMNSLLSIGAAMFRIKEPPAAEPPATDNQPK